MVTSSIATLRGTSDIQHVVMIFINDWTHHNKTPVTRKILIRDLERDGLHRSSIVDAIHFLIIKGYIRKAVGTTNGRSYVQLRGL